MPRQAMASRSKTGNAHLFPLTIKRSSIDGRGLFVLTNIPARSKIGELTGETISRREARRRARGLEKIAIVELDSVAAIDGSIDGNEFRFVNHSCEPNTYMRRCYRRVEFYALRDIKACEEITCDYEETHHNGTRRCTCRSLRCRGYI